MNVVAIETATETVGAAVRTSAGVQAEFALTGRRRHVESLVPALAHLFEQVGLEAGAIGAVAVDVGPGLFTGLRVGVATAKGLAQALGVGVIGLSSLDILRGAAGALGHGGPVLSVVDARRGEVFASLGDVGATEGSADALAPGLWSPDALAAALSALGAGEILAVGDGAQRYAEVLGAVGGVTCLMGVLQAPPAPTLLALALARLDRGVTPVPAAEVVPLYMREADARSNFAQVERVAAPSPVEP